MTKLRNHQTTWMLRSEFLTALKEFDPILDKELINTYMEECSVNVVGVTKPTIDVHLMANHYLEREVKLSHGQ